MLPRSEWGIGYDRYVMDGEDMAVAENGICLGVFKVRLDWPIGRR